MLSYINAEEIKVNFERNIKTQSYINSIKSNLPLENIELNITPTIVNTDIKVFYDEAGKAYEKINISEEFPVKIGDARYQIAIDKENKIYSVNQRISKIEFLVIKSIVDKRWDNFVATGAKEPCVQTHYYGCVGKEEYKCVFTHCYGCWVEQQWVTGPHGPMIVEKPVCGMMVTDTTCKPTGEQCR
ncbi:MAG: hypothetical protein K6357_01045 [Elusimicrobiota bacterium]